MSIDILPPELLKDILAFRNDPITCSFVCKLWKANVPPHQNDRDYVNDLIEEGSINILKWAEPYLPIDDGYIHTATVCGQLEIAKWLVDIHPGIQAYVDEIEVAKTGNIEMMNYLLELGCELDENVLSGGIESDSLEMVKWLREHGCPWNENAWLDAARTGSIPTLVYLLQEGCPSDDGACAEAIMYGKLGALKWLLDHGHPLDPEDCDDDDETADSMSGDTLLGRKEVFEWLKTFEN